MKNRGGNNLDWWLIDNPHKTSLSEKDCDDVR